MLEVLRKLPPLVLLLLALLLLALLLLALLLRVLLLRVLRRLALRRQVLRQGPLQQLVPPQRVLLLAPLQQELGVLQELLRL